MPRRNRNVSSGKPEKPEDWFRGSCAGARLRLGPSRGADSEAGDGSVLARAPVFGAGFEPFFAVPATSELLQSHQARTSFSRSPFAAFASATLPSFSTRPVS